MRPLAVTCVLTLLLLVPHAAAQQPGAGAAPAAAPAPVAPKAHAGDGWSIAAPADWAPLPRVPPPVRLYLVGDGREGVPLFDGTLSPLKAGLLVERLVKQDVPLKQRALKEVADHKASGRFRFTEEPAAEDITLSDGTAAVLLRLVFLRRENGRLSVQRKVYCAEPGGTVLVATGFITCGPAGRKFIDGVGLPSFVEAHVRSLVLAPDKLDLAKLKPAYAGHAWNIGAALDHVTMGNRLLEKNDYATAADAFREALALCEHLSAANNGLAWALLHGEGAGAKDREEALKLATKAVEQTDSLDYSALDTLALAQFKTGDKPGAVKTIRKALRLRPNHPELVKRLKSFGAE